MYLHISEELLGGYRRSTSEGGGRFIHQGETSGFLCVVIVLVFWLLFFCSHIMFRVCSVLDDCLISASSAIPSFPAQPPCRTRIFLPLSQLDSFSLGMGKVDNRSS